MLPNYFMTIDPAAAKDILLEEDIDWLIITAEFEGEIPAEFQTFLLETEKKRNKIIGTLKILSEEGLTTWTVDEKKAFACRFTLPLNSPENFIQKQFQQLVDSLKKHNKAISENQSFKQDLKLARNVHNKILHNPLPDKEILDISVQYIPHLAIGGDFYIVKEISKGQYLLFLSDATGHGLKAALIIMVIKTILENILKRSTEPEIVLKYVNDNITGMLGASFCGTAFCAHIDLEKRKIRYSSAAHPPQILWPEKGQGFIELFSNSVCLGIFEDEEFVEREHNFEPGDRLLLFTDGLYEFQAMDGNIFGIQNFYQIVREMEKVTSMDKLSQEIIQKIKSMHLDPYAGDDINLIAVRFPD
ncbi:PP2C family protein-serine/threonine phosphatase [Candidatus Riflebacteria bacterium]